MSINPFFSGRIPQELYNKADEYCKEVGKKKTELLIEALSTYLNFPLNTQTTNFVSKASQPEVTKEMFNRLQEQVDRLEQLLYENMRDFNKIDSIDNKNLDTTIENSGNNEVNYNELENSKLALVRFDNKIIDNQHDNNDNNDNNESQLVNKKDYITELLHFESVRHSKFVEITGLTLKQANGLKGTVTQKLKKQGKLSPSKQLLDSPLLVETKKSIVIKGHPYNLFYLGENDSGEALWSLSICNNKAHQPVITELNYSNYEIDNKNISG